MNHHVQHQAHDVSCQAEPLMGDAKQLMKLVLQSEEIGTYRMDLKSGEIWCSDRALAIHGLGPEARPYDLDTALSHYHPDDAKKLAYLVMTAIKDRVGFNFTLRIIRQDGKQRLVHSAASLSYGAGGRPVAINGTFKDVTESRSSRDIAASSSQLVRSLITNTPAPTIVLDKKLCYLEISPSWIEYYGLPSRSELLGKKHYDVQPNLPEEFRQDNRRALAGEVVRSRFSFDQDSTGITTSLAAVVFPWHTADGAIGGIIVMLTPPETSGQRDDEPTQQAGSPG